MEELGALLLLMVAAVILGNLWFHLVESLLEKLRRLLGLREPPPVWHPFPNEEEKNDDM